jgi:hypothetical protein
MIALDTELRRYEFDDYGLLQADCEETESSTRIVPLDSHEQAILDDDFRTVRGGYRYTWYAMGQMCRAVCSGMRRCLDDISGHLSTADSAPVSPHLASRMLNAAIRLRFAERVGDWQLLVDERRMSIEAVLGKGYRRLPNSVFLEAVNSTLGQSLRFDSASISGRRIAAYYAGSDRSSDNLPGNTYRYGVIASNSETGDAGVRIRRTVEFGKVARMQRPYDGRQVVRHIGRKFEDKIRALLLVASTPPSYDATSKMEAAWEAAHGRKLGFSGQNSEEDFRVRESLMEELRRWDLSKPFRQNSLRRVLFSGGLEPAPKSAIREETGHLWSSRSWGDLLVSLSAEAGDYPILSSLRERVERTCYLRLLIQNGGDPYVDSH